MKKMLTFALLFLTLSLHFSSGLLFAPERPKQLERPFEVNSSSANVFDIAMSTQPVHSFSTVKALPYPTDPFVLRDTPHKYLIPNSEIQSNAKFTLVFNNPSSNIVTQAKIYDITGAEVADFLEETPAGSDPDQLSWDGHDKNGSIVRSGIYIYQIQAGNVVNNGTIVVVR